MSLYRMQPTRQAVRLSMVSCATKMQVSGTATSPDSAGNYHDVLQVCR
jgi:hypothetical protein